MTISDAIDHLTTSGLAIACLYVVFRQWQSDIRVHQRDDMAHRQATDERIQHLTNAINAMGTQVNALLRIVAKHEQERR